MYIILKIFVLPTSGAGESIAAFWYLKAIKILPPPLDNTTSLNERRLWVGNLDEKITEFSLLRLLQKYGKIESFDFLVHRNGPEKGKPKGYGYVTYSTLEEAQKAMKCLDGKRAHQKRLAVKPARANPVDELPVFQSRSARPASDPSSSTSESPSSQIDAIEAKLREMQGGTGNLFASTSAESKHRYHYQRDAQSSHTQQRTRTFGASQNKPYNRTNRTRTCVYRK